MDYQKVYNQIIERAKHRKIEGYTERHHIIPKCLGGDYSKNNIVVLTAREHFICHTLLVKIYPNERKLKYAIWMMVNGAGGKDRYCPSSKTYENIKREYSGLMRKNRLGKKHSKKTINKMSKIKKGVSLSEEHKMNISKALQGRKISNKTLIAVSKPKPQTQIKKRVEKMSIPVLQFNLKGELIKEWESQTIASKSTFINRSTINRCLNPITPNKTAGGYIWKYKEE